MRHLLALIAALLIGLSAQAQTSVVGNAKVVGTATVAGTPPPNPNPAFVQGGGCSFNGAAATCTVTLSAVGVGHYLIGYCGSNTTCNPPTTTGGDTFTIVSNCSQITGLVGSCYVVTNTGGGETVITGNIVATGAGGFSVVEYTSPAGGHAVDVSGSGNSGSTAMSVATTSSTTTANDMCVGMGLGNQAGAWTQGSGWTARVNISSSTLIPYMQEQGFASSSSAVTSTATAPVGTTVMTEGVVCVKP